MLNRDRDLLRQLGSLDAVISHHSDVHKESGFNPSRVRSHLSDDPNFSLLLDIADRGGEVDVDEEFVPHLRASALRRLHLRMLPVYRLHQSKCGNPIGRFSFANLTLATRS